ncbi:flavin reductase [Porcincola sp. LCP21S3_C12]|jgi:flavin reductase (DIM6/NTAB) family NADH-FMN oxidoreductase RutF|uniref:flavin reductase n=1 Tax=Porcincola sp. LCP21S3_C12 TaxID=3438798 RepID=UPI003F98C60E
MSDFENNGYKVFDLFRKQWAVVAAGNMEKFNACTVSWGSLGTLWTRPGHSGSIVTVYLYPTRYTRELVAENENFTVSFFPKDYKKALAILGTRSGRNEDKIAVSGLTPIPVAGSVAFKEASLTFVCRKIYQHQMTKSDLAQDIQDYYAADPKAYPPVSGSGEWEPHWVFVGEITEVLEG